MTEDIADRRRAVRDELRRQGDKLAALVIAQHSDATPLGDPEPEPSAPTDPERMPLGHPGE